MRGSRPFNQGGGVLTSFFSFLFVCIFSHQIVSKRPVRRTSLEEQLDQRGPLLLDEGLYRNL